MEKPTKKMKLLGLVEANANMLGDCVRTSGIGIGFQDSSRPDENLDGKIKSYRTFLQVPGTNQVVKAYGSPSVWDYDDIASTFKASSDSGKQLEVIAYVRDINPIILDVTAVRFGQYTMGNEGYVERFKDTGR